MCGMWSTEWRRLGSYFMCEWGLLGGRDLDRSLWEKCGLLSGGD